MSIQLPNDEIMRIMAKLAMEQAAEYFAKMAEQFAADVPPDSSPEIALLAFAAAIRSTRDKLDPPAIPRTTQ
jgi:hypothetical protein